MELLPRPRLPRGYGPISSSTTSARTAQA